MDRAKARPDSTRRWKASWAGKVVLVDERTAEAVLAPRECTRALLGGSAGRDRRCQRPLARLRPGRQSPDGARFRRDLRRACVRENAGAEHSAAGSRSCSSAVKRRAAGAASPQGGAASHGRRVRFTPSAKHPAAARRKPRARKSSDPRVLVSLVGCRSRGEASCPCSTRGAARQTEWNAGQHGSATQPLDGGRAFDAVGESRRSDDARTGRKGATKLRVNVTGNAKPTHSVSRPRLEPTEGALDRFCRCL